MPSNTFTTQKWTILVNEIAIYTGNSRVERHFNEEEESKENSKKNHEILPPNTVFGVRIIQRPLPSVGISGTGMLADRAKRDHAPAGKPAHGRRKQHRADSFDPENKRKESKA